MSLLEITKLPTEENSAIHMSASDNIAVARVPLSPGQRVRLSGEEPVTIREHIGAGHKIAIRAIAEGKPVIRYGQVMGRAKARIEPGAHVHVHNVAFEELTFNYEFPTDDRAPAQASSPVPTFLGYPRGDGRTGTRNYIAIVAASNCAAHAAELIAASYADQNLPPGVDGVAAFPHGEGCGMSVGPDTIQLQRTLAGVLDHPNVSGAIVLGLGCEVNQIEHYLGASAPQGGRLVGMTVQGSGGSRATLDAARM